jgi:spore germination protein
MKRYISLILLLCLLSGCIQEQIIDRIKIIQYMGFDTQGDSFKGSASYPIYGKAQGKAPLMLLTARAQTVMGMFTTFSNQSEHPIEYGKMRTLLISEDFAKKGISEFAVDLIRDSTIGSNATVVITKQDANEILLDSLPLPPFYISDLIEQNMDLGNTPLTNLHSLQYQFYGEGQDVYLPILIKNPEGKLQMDGVGIFQGDKLKLLLNDKEGLYFKLIKDRVNSGTYEFTTTDKIDIYLKIKYGSTKISLKQNGKVAVLLKLNIIAANYPEEMNLTNRNDMTKLAQQIENKFAVEIKKMLENFQENDVDPLGLGNLYRSKQRSWSEKEFRDVTYPALKFDVSTKITLQLGSGQ